MNKLLTVLITMIYILLPYNVFADNNDDLIETKYYKTIIYRYGIMIQNQ